MTDISAVPGQVWEETDGPLLNGKPRWFAVVDAGQDRLGLTHVERRYTAGVTAETLTANLNSGAWRLVAHPGSAQPLSDGWAGVEAVVDRLTADDPADDVAPTNDRGFLGYARLKDTHGGEVRVYQSSAVWSGDQDGPFVWLNVDSSAWRQPIAEEPDERFKAAAHLNREQAARVVRGLARWLADTE